MLTYTALDSPVEEHAPSSYKQEASYPNVSPRNKWEVHFSLSGQ